VGGAVVSVLLVAFGDRLSVGRIQVNAPGDCHLTVARGKVSSILLQWIPGARSAGRSHRLVLR